MSCILQYVNYTSMELIFESFNPVCPESAYITPCYAHVLNHFSHVWLCESLCTVAFQAPLCMGFSRQEYWDGLPYPPAGDAPNPGIEPASFKSHWQKGSLPLKCKSESGVKVSVAQSCPTLMGCSPPGSSVHRILQARILEWVTITFSRGSSWPRDWTQVPCIEGKFFTI